MSVLSNKELRIVGFLCNWCSYGGADTAGVGRFAQPTDLRIIRVPCSGRIDPIFVLKALMKGADGVLVSGCHPRDCHYTEGNFYARRRLEVLKGFLPILGIDPGRFTYTWVSASEGPRWQQVVTAFTEQIHALGPAPRYDQLAWSTPPAVGVGVQPASGAARLPVNGKQPLPLEALKEKIRGELPDLACVIGWQQGYDPLHHTPLFIRSPEDLDRLVLGPLTSHNPATYLTAFRGRPVGVVVKGCDSRSVVELLQEKLIEREQITIFGVPCSGIADLARVRIALEQAGLPFDRVDEVIAEDGMLTFKATGKTCAVPLIEVAADKCLHCRFPNAVLADHFVGDPGLPAGPAESPSATLAALDAMSLLERMSFWRYHMERCIRCHACRNVCPLCVCRDHCVAGSREPHWLSREDSVTEKLFFLAIHALHLAGRCTECGECERACPMNIPILALKSHLNRVIHRLFEYRAGIDPQAVPPLLTFEMDEKNIHEGGW